MAFFFKMRVKPSEEFLDKMKCFNSRKSPRISLFFDYVHKCCILFHLCRIIGGPGSFLSLVLLLHLFAKLTDGWNYVVFVVPEIKKYTLFPPKKEMLQLCVDERCSWFHSLIFLQGRQTISLMDLCTSLENWLFLITYLLFFLCRFLILFFSAQLRCWSLLWSSCYFNNCSWA